MAAGDVKQKVVHAATFLLDAPPGEFHEVCEYYWRLYLLIWIGPERYSRSLEQIHLFHSCVQISVRWSITTLNFKMESDWPCVITILNNLLLRNCQALLRPRMLSRRFVLRFLCDFLMCQDCRCNFKIRRNWWENLFRSKNKTIVVGPCAESV